ncbi:MAG: PSD1 domain-containing protein [Planctomycetia bacterium]|nr:PSD1 domain-containing protein [Planctomycetia bacterium]
MRRHLLTLAGSLAALLLTCAPAIAADPPAKKDPPAAAPDKPSAEKAAAESAAVPAHDPKGFEFFEKKIRPVLVGKCFACHSAQAKELKGGLRLDTHDGMRKGGESGPAIVPGNGDASLLVEALRHEGLEMPPKTRLPDNVVADFVAWIDMGAPDPRSGTAARKGLNLAEARKFWAFQPPKTAAPPQVKDAAWPKSEIDRFVLARLESVGLHPVDDADKRTLIRRATLDLIGLPPTPEEVDAFLADDSPEAFAKVVDRLLASPQFGERWGRHWLDVARYAESTGKERNVPYPYAWRYRDYVIDSFNEDKPYDEFVMEQVAGDLLPHKSPAERNEQLVATGFLAIGTKGLNERNREQYTMDVIDEQIDVVGRAFLGLTVSCARCHDHKFDPIPTEDYYALAGIFRSTAIYSGVRQGNNKAGYAGDLFALADAKPQTIGREDQAAINKLENDLARAEAELKTQTAQAKTTQSEPSAEKPDKPKNANKKPAADNPKKKKAAAADAKKVEKAGESDGADIQADAAAKKKKQLEKKKAAAAAAKKSLSPAEQKVADLQKELAALRDKVTPKPELAMAVAESDKPVNCRVNIRGEVNDLGPEVPRGFVRVLMGPSPTTRIEQGDSGRRELARWLTAKENPLTARVMVNRIWQHLFGAGLVETTDNFGNLGEQPTHPELLDHLAVQFQKDGWSVKTTIRRIMLSRTYQLSSQHDAKGVEVDEAGRLLWRMTPRRLDAEAIRDAVLFVSGKIDLARPEASPVARLANGEVGRNLNLAPLQAADAHRSVYLPLLRGVVPEMLQVFDAADPSLVVGQREVTTVATQALFMLNSPFMQEQSEQLARRVLAPPKLTDAQRIQLAYQLALARPASDDETQRVLSYLREYPAAGAAASASAPSAEAWSTFCQTLFASAEFRYVY